MEIFLAILFGTAFGFVLNRVGATNPQYIITMLRLTNTHLMRTILFAIGFSSILLFAGLATGLIDSGNLSVKASYIGVMIGGAILGLGFAIAGYCPGTGVCAAATGRLDGAIFILGGLLGAFLYALSYQGIKDTGILNDIWGGKTTLAQTGIESYPALLDFAPGFVTAIIFGLAMMFIAWKLPRTLLRDE